MNGVMLRRALVVLALSLGAQAVPAAASLPTGQWPLAGRGSLRAPLAWQQSTGDGTVVAVLDTGVQLNRRELRGHIWTNPGEIPGNGRDDDGDGFVDDTHGADFVNGDGSPADDNGHGTHVAGIIAGHGLIRGLAPGATILPVKVLGADKAGNALLVAQGIDYAVAHGARILNVSVNGDGISSDLEAAIRRAQDAGAVIVASAGNDGRDLSQHPSYPVSYPEPAVIGVGATGLTRGRAAFSNFGAGVDVTAPGVDIISLGLRGLAYRSGTSMAAAYVSATLALEAAAAPARMAGELRDALVRTARSQAVDAAAAVRAVAGREPARKKRRRRARHNSRSWTKSSTPSALRTVTRQR
jgi:subtilisin family serine protease